MQSKQNEWRQSTLATSYVITDRHIAQSMFLARERVSMKIYNCYGVLKMSGFINLPFKHKNEILLDENSKLRFHKFNGRKQFRSIKSLRKKKNSLNHELMPLGLSHNFMIKIWSRRYLQILKNPNLIKNIQKHIISFQ